MKLTPRSLLLGVVAGGCFFLLLMLTDVGEEHGQQVSKDEPKMAIADASSASTAKQIPTVQRESNIVPGGDQSNEIGRRLKELRKTLNPHDAFRAYKIVANCRNLKSRETMLVNLPASTEQAQRYSEFQTSEAQSLAECRVLSGSDEIGWQQDLLRAANAKVPGAAAAFLFEGPFGDPNAYEHRANDPLVVQWKAQALSYLVGAAKDGDLDSLRALAHSYDFSNGGTSTFVDQSLTESVIYLTAAIEILKDRGDRYQAEIKWRDSTVKKMDAATAADAIRRGEEIAKTCCIKRS